VSHKLETWFETWLTGIAADTVHDSEAKRRSIRSSDASDMKADQKKPILGAEIHQVPLARACYFWNTRRLPFCREYEVGGGLKKR